MKIRISLILCVCILLFGSICVHAEFVDKAEVSDASSGTITVSGTLEAGENNRIVSVFFLEDEASAENIAENQDRLQYVGMGNVNYAGEWMCSFNVNVATGKYYLAVKHGENSYISNINFINPGEGQMLAENIALGKYNAEDLCKELENVLLDMSRIQTKARRELMLKRMNEGKTKITVDGIDAVLDIYNDVQTEATMLDELSATKVWSDVYRTFETYAQKYSISFDEYNKLTGSQRITANTALIGGTYESAESAVQAFYSAVRSAGNSDTSGGQGSSGGSHSSGGRTSSSRYITPTMSDSTPDTEKAKDVFCDLTNCEWARKAIETLATRGIINGISAERFDPDAMITREQFAKIVCCAFSLYDESAISEFEDVKKNSWYEKYVASVQKTGVVSGIDDKTFGVGQNITRQEMAVMLYRAVLYNGGNMSVKKNDFDDYDAVDEWAQEAVTYMAGMGYISGKDNNCFAPLETATRAEAAQMVYNCIKGA